MHTVYAVSRLGLEISFEDWLKQMGFDSESQFASEVGLVELKTRVINAKQPPFVLDDRKQPKEVNLAKMRLRGLHLFCSLDTQSLSPPKQVLSESEINIYSDEEGMWVEENDFL